jgi:PAS domain S-box-containing protein
MGDIGREVLGAVADVVVVIDGEGMFRHVFAGEELLPKETAGRAMSAIRRVIDTGERGSFDYELVGEGGVSRAYSARLAPLDHGSERLVALVARDVSDQKRLERELRTSEARNRSLVENSAEAIVVLDIDTGRFCDANQRALDLWGMSRDELLQNGPAELSPPRQPDGRDSKQAAMEVIRECIDGGLPEFEWVHQNLRGEPIECAIRLVRLPDPERRLVRGSVMDIGYRKQLERELAAQRERLAQMVEERTSELEAANQELHGFNYSVSHDLRAPVRAIAGYVNELEQERGALTDEGRDNLERVRAAAARMSRMLDSLLELSTVTQRPPRRTRVDLSALATEVGAAIGERYAGRTVELTVQPKMTVTGDAGMLRVALTNLLDNAWKFTRDARKPRVEVGSEARVGGVEYFVRDNGAGFDMKFADKLFGPFGRLHHEGEFEGAGIGLATVYRIVKRHGGTIRATSKVGSGATIWFTLPAG